MATSNAQAFIIGQRITGNEKKAKKIITAGRSRAVKNNVKKRQQNKSLGDLLTITAPGQNILPAAFTCIILSHYLMNCQC
jgi:hypothetical protein